MGSAVFVTHGETRTYQVPNPRPNPGTGTHNYYFGERQIAVDGPQAYMVNFDPGLRNRAHFHHVDQFQVFFGTPGSTYQRHEIGALMVQYADADTVYGPFGSGDGPLSFITLRRFGSDFIGYLPEDRDKLPKKPRRNFQSALSEWLGGALPGEHAVTSESLFPEQADGLTGLRISAGPRAAIDLPDPARSGGQFYVVVAGEVDHDARLLPTQSVGWSGPDDPVARLTAGDAGARLLCLQFAPEPA